MPDKISADVVQLEGLQGLKNVPDKSNVINGFAKKNERVQLNNREDIQKSAPPVD